MRKAIFLFGVALIAASVHAEPSREAKAFGARESIQGISLSPDGRKVAVIVADGARGQLLTVSDFSNTPLKPILRGAEGSERLDYCRWTTESGWSARRRSRSTAPAR